MSVVLKARSPRRIALSTSIACLSLCGLLAMADEPVKELPAPVASWTERVVPPDARDFWAFQPLRVTTSQAVKNASQVRTPIDGFVLEKLAAKGLAFSPPAEKVQLLRRAYFDLVGLPPPPEAVAAFLNDASPDGWRLLIDRLLDSPQYGERWARHWLDISRFA